MRRHSSGARGGRPTYVSGAGTIVFELERALSVIDNKTREPIIDPPTADDATIRLLPHHVGLQLTRDLFYLSAAAAALHVKHYVIDLKVIGARLAPITEMAEKHGAFEGVLRLHQIPAILQEYSRRAVDACVVMPDHFLLDVNTFLEIPALRQGRVRAAGEAAEEAETDAEILAATAAAAAHNVAQAALRAAAGGGAADSDESNGSDDGGAGAPAATPMQPPGGAPAADGGAAEPKSWLMLLYDSLTYGHLIEPESTFGTFGAVGPIAAVGLFETLALGRLSAEPETAHQHLKFMLSKVLRSMVDTLGVIDIGLRGADSEVPADLDPAEFCEEFGRRLRLLSRAREIDDVYVKLSDARRYMASVVDKLPYDFGPLTVDDLMRAIDALPPLVTVLGGRSYCTASPNDAMIYSMSLAGVVGITSTALTLSDTKRLASEVTFLAPSFAQEEVQVVSIEARCAKAMELVREKLDASKTTTKDKDDADDTSDSKMIGYPKRQHEALYRMIGLDSFQALVAKVGYMIDGAHPDPTAIIGVIVTSRNVMLLSGLCEWKKEVATVPIVKMIREQLTPHGPAYFGRIGAELLMPESYDHQGRYPKLVKLWSGFKKGSLNLDYENDLILAVKAFYATGGATLEPATRVPANQVFASPLRNASMLQNVADPDPARGFLDRQGWTGLGGIIIVSNDFVNNNPHEMMATRKKVMREHIVDSLVECSIRFVDIVLDPSPDKVYGGPIQLSTSPARAAFEAEVKLSNETLKHTSAFNRMGLGGRLGNDIRPPDLDHEPPTADKPPATAAPAAATAAAKKEKDKKPDVELIGSKAKQVKVEGNLLTFKGAKNETYPIDKVPSGLCAPVAYSKSPKAFMFCTQPGKPGHTTCYGGAHAITQAFRKLAPTLMVLSAVTDATLFGQPSPIPLSRFAPSDAPAGWYHAPLTSSRADTVAGWYQPTRSSLQECPKDSSSPLSNASMQRVETFSEPSAGFTERLAAWKDAPAAGTPAFMPIALEGHKATAGDFESAPRSDFQTAAVSSFESSSFESAPRSDFQTAADSSFESSSKPDFDEAKHAYVPTGAAADELGLARPLASTFYMPGHAGSVDGPTWITRSAPRVGVAGPLQVPSRSDFDSATVNSSGGVPNHDFEAARCTYVPTAGQPSHAFVPIALGQHEAYVGVPNFEGIASGTCVKDESRQRAPSARGQDQSEQNSELVRLRAQVSCVGAAVPNAQATCVGAQVSLNQSAPEPNAQVSCVSAQVPLNRLFGSARAFVNREEDYARARVWSRALFPPELKVHPFYFFELRAEPIVVSGAIVGRYDSAGGHLDHQVRPPSIPGITWMNVTSSCASGLVGLILDVAHQRARGFAGPTAKLSTEVITGAMSERRLESRQVLVAAKARPRDWARVVERAECEMLALADECERRLAGAEVGSPRYNSMMSWMPALRPIEWEEVPHELRNACLDTTDPRLARVAFPYIPAVHSAPLAPLAKGPPPTHRVPSWATEWHHAILPRANEALLGVQRANRAHWRYVGAHGTTKGAPRAPRFAANSSILYKWARQLVDEGEIIVRRDGRLTLLDQSRAPNFTLSSEYAWEMLKDSPDAALRDACCRVGVVYDVYDRHSRLLSIAPPMDSIKDGLISIHDSLRKMVKRGWFEVHRATDLDNGYVCLSSIPGCMQSVGCIPRNYSSVFRMVVNNSHEDHKGLYTTEGERVPMVSFNRSIGVWRDKSIRRAEAATLALPAKRPATVSVQALAERPPYTPPVVLPGSDPVTAAVVPPELKAYFYMIMVSTTVLHHVAEILDMPVYLAGDDFSKFFHVFAIAHRQSWACQLMTLNPEQVVEATKEADIEAVFAKMNEAELAVIQEWCMSMGTANSSSYAQRYTTEFCNRLVTLFHEQHKHEYARLAKDNPRLAAWFKVRDELSLATGTEQGILMFAYAYSDDPIAGTLGCPWTCDLCELYDGETKKAQMLRGDASKRSFGVHVKFLGAWAFTSGLLGYVSSDKRLRALDGLHEGRAGRLTVKKSLELFGLLHHIVFTSALPPYVMYHIYDGIDQLHRDAKTRAQFKLKRRALFLCGGEPAPGDRSLEAIGADFGFEVENIDVVHGRDLLQPKVQEYVIRGVHAKRWMYIHAGNPCRSYSVGHQPQLRSVAKPRGILPIPKAWAAYLANDTALMLFCFKVLTLADDVGLLWSAEHPSPRDDVKSHAYWPKMAHREVGTQWHDKAVLNLTQRATTVVFDFPQCALGSPFQKYTRMAMARALAVHLAPRLRAGYKCTCTSHARVAQGYDELGVPNSRAAAKYPLPMQQAIFEGASMAIEDLGLDRRPVEPLDPNQLVPVTARSAKAFDTWSEKLGERSGTSMLGSIFHGTAPATALRVRIHADAAKRGTTEPGITGNLYGYYYTLALNNTTYAAWPIVALEFAGEGPLNLATFGSLLEHAHEIVLPSDSLVAPLTMASRARQSRLLQYMHERYLQMPSVRKLWGRLSCSHEYGVGNPICDRGSRGSENEMLEIMHQLNLKPHKLSIPQEGIDYMNDVDAFFRKLTDEDRSREYRVLTQLKTERSTARTGQTRGGKQAAHWLARASLASAVARTSAHSHGPGQCYSDSSAWGYLSASAVASALMLIVIVVVLAAWLCVHTQSARFLIDRSWWVPEQDGLSYQLSGCSELYDRLARYAAWVNFWQRHHNLGTIAQLPPEQRPPCVPLLYTERYRRRAWRQAQVELKWDAGQWEADHTYTLHGVVVDEDDARDSDEESEGDYAINMFRVLEASPDWRELQRQQHAADYNMTQLVTPVAHRPRYSPLPVRRGESDWMPEAPATPPTFYDVLCVLSAWWWSVMMQLKRAWSRIASGAKDRAWSIIVLLKAPQVTAITIPNATSPTSVVNVEMNCASAVPWSAIAALLVVLLLLNALFAHREAIEAWWRRKTSRARCAAQQGELLRYWNVKRDASAAVAPATQNGRGAKKHGWRMKRRAQALRAPLPRNAYRPHTPSPAPWSRASNCSHGHGMSNLVSDEGSRERARPVGVPVEECARIFGTWRTGRAAAGYTTVRVGSLSPPPSPPGEFGGGSSTSEYDSSTLSSAAAGSTAASASESQPLPFEPGMPEVLLGIVDATYHIVRDAVMEVDGHACSPLLLVGSPSELVTRYGHAVERLIRTENAAIYDAGQYQLSRAYPNPATDLAPPKPVVLNHCMRDEEWDTLLEERTAQDRAWTVWAQHRACDDVSRLNTSRVDAWAEAHDLNRAQGIYSTMDALGKQVTLPALPVQVHRPTEAVLQLPSHVSLPDVHMLPESYFGGVCYAAETMVVAPFAQVEMWLSLRKELEYVNCSFRTVVVFPSPQNNAPAESLEVTVAPARCNVVDGAYDGRYILALITNMCPSSPCKIEVHERMAVFSSSPLVQPRFAMIGGDGGVGMSGSSGCFTETPMQMGTAESSAAAQQRANAHDDARPDLFPLNGRKRVARQPGQNTGTMRAPSIGRWLTLLALCVPGLASPQEALQRMVPKRNVAPVRPSLCQSYSFAPHVPSPHLGPDPSPRIVPARQTRAQPASTPAADVQADASQRILPEAVRFLRQPQVEPAPVHDASGWVDGIVHDRSAYAIMPRDPELLESHLDRMREFLDRSYATSTSKADRYHLTAWSKAMRKLDTPIWRTDVAANSGLDPVGHRRELIVIALGLLIMYANMSPRCKGDPAANPRSALAKLYGVAREHKKRGFRMAPFTVAMQVVNGMMQKFVDDHGADSLIPSRKNPLTNAMIDGMLSTIDGTVGSGLKVRWSLYFWVAVFATFAVLAETGMRKGDVSKPLKSTPHRKGRLTFDKVVWLINKIKVVAPTMLQFLGMRGGGCWIRFGVLKNDAFGEFFGSKPVFLSFNPHERTNACNALRRLEMTALEHGLTPDKRRNTPLFGPVLGVEWHHSLLDRVFFFLLSAGARIAPDELAKYSVHSFRIYLACALYAAGCPPERIMAMLRWKSEEALRIYARQNDDERASWIVQAKTQQVNSIVAASLPRIDQAEWVARFRDSLATGALRRDAAAADSGLENDLDDSEVFA